MGEIQAQVVAADINDDGILEIVSADVRGNVAAWTRDGKELWTVHLKSLIAQVLLSVQLLLNSLYLVFASRQIEYL